MQAKAYIISENQTLADKDKWALQFGDAFGSFAFVNSVYLNEVDMHNMVNNGTIDSHYRSSWVQSFDANAKNLTATQDTRHQPGRLPHELGCTLGHRSAWKQFLQEYSSGTAAPWAAFFESDTGFQSDFRERAKNLQSALQTMPAWDLVFMGHCFEHCAPSPGSVSIGGNVYVMNTTAALCTNSYLLSVKGAQTLLSGTMPLQAAIDEKMEAAYRSGAIKSLSVCPRITQQPWQGNRNSDEYLRLGPNPSYDD